MDENLQKYIDVLNDEQKVAVIHEGKSLLILAGAGSGKTRVITTKIAWLISEKNIPPYQILSVTFTKKAANEMRERAVAIDARAAEAQIRTFHSFGSWFLRRYNEEAGLEKSFTVYDDDDMVSLVKKACPHLKPKDAKLAAHQISLAKDYCLGPDDDLSIIDSEYDLNDIYKRYNQRLRSTGNADFGDLIMLPVLILKNNPQIASYIHNRFKVIMVDEYQDSNIAQYKLLQELSGIRENSDNYVCVVGDDDQSIYKFRGAEVQNILDFPKKFPGTDIIRLERNYRSTARILNAASLVVKNNENRLGKTLIADRGEGGQPVMIFTMDQNAEAKLCGDLIQKYVEKGTLPNGKVHRYSDWALLYRTNAQSLNFEKEFLRRKIPYKVVGSLKFYEREEIKDALAYLSLVANARDEISFRRIINKPARGIGEKTQDNILASALVVEEKDGDYIQYYKNLFEVLKNQKEKLSKKAAEGVGNFIKLYENLNNFFETHKNSKEKKLSDFIERLIIDSELEDYYMTQDEIEGSTKKDNLREFINSAVPYECSPEGLTEFLDAINLDRSLEEENDNGSGDAVTLITIHNTKGLEYNNVIITGLEEGVFPRANKTGAELEEERRLFYVGITRAKNQLFVTLASKRCIYGRWEYMRPSIFASEAAPAFKLLGSVPFGFSFSANKNKPTVSSFGRDASGFASSNRGAEDSVFGEKSGIAKKYPKGTKIYHDEYGNGVIISAGLNEGEYLIEVLFESGFKKKFLPEYQEKSLQIMKV